jgi:hypothetical protein
VKTRGSTFAFGSNFDNRRDPDELDEPAVKYEPLGLHALVIAMKSECNGVLVAVEVRRNVRIALKYPVATVERLIVTINTIPLPEASPSDEAWNASRTTSNGSALPTRAGVVKTAASNRFKGTTGIVRGLGGIDGPFAKSAHCPTVQTHRCTSRSVFGF